MKREYDDDSDAHRRVKDELDDNERRDRHGNIMQNRYYRPIKHENDHYPRHDRGSRRGYDGDDEKYEQRHSDPFNSRSVITRIIL